MSVRSLSFALAAVIALGACSSGSRGGGGTAPATTGGTAPVASAGSAPAAARGGGSSEVEAQVQRGSAVYAGMCAKCHGGSGAGSATAPPLVGPGALPADPRPGSRVRTGAFRSAMDVGQFILASMPPGTTRISKPDCAAVLAWTLRQNGIPFSQAIDPSTAGAIPLR